MLKEDTVESDSMNNEVQEVMKDNLELMLEVVMKIREDEEFAKNIYANCPRLQHLMEEHPDLRPVFEDPKLVRLNFEQVYRDNGGVLPEDKPKKKSCLSKVVNHPLFKVLRFFLLIKKLLNCIMGGGFAMIKGCFAGLCFEEAAEHLGGDAGGDGAGEGGGDADGGDHQPSPENQANQEKLNAAADHMEDPEVQERMNEILENNPDDLAEAIENDPELKALRDSNALCAELMGDPDTMRILVDPDNLRALGEAPDLIEQDFANPDWSAPNDLEVGADGADVDVNADVDADADQEVAEEEKGVYDEEAAEEGEDEEGMMEDFEMEKNEGKSDNADASNRKKGRQKKSDRKKNKNGGGGGFLGGLATGITDMVAAEVVGFGMGELTSGGDGLDGLEDEVPADDLADAADEAGNAAADNANAAVAASEVLLNDDVAGGLEDGMDDIEDTQEDGKSDSRTAERAKAGAIGAGAGLAVHSIPTNSRGRGVVEGEEDKDGKKKAVDDDETVAEDADGEVEGENKKKKSRFRAIGKAVSSMATAAKEHVATAVLGDDVGEMLVEKIEESDDEEDEDKNAAAKKKEEEKKQKEVEKRAAKEEKKKRKAEKKR
jgi:hypothetical protein